MDGFECEPSWAGVDAMRREVDAIASANVLEHRRLDNLAGRVAGALVETRAVDAVGSMLDLIRDTLDLVPSDLDVRAARERTERRLAAVPEAS